MDRDQKLEKCKEFFGALVEKLSGEYELVNSCNQDISQYLIPNGSIDELTYYSKPELSFRISDHWNWYASLTKCEKEHYIQCYTKEMPWTQKRLREGKASRAIQGISVCLMGVDGLYHVVYGERFDRKSKKWTWFESDPSDIAALAI